KTRPARTSATEVEFGRRGITDYADDADDTDGRKEVAPTKHTNHTNERELPSNFGVFSGVSWAKTILAYSAQRKNTNDRHSLPVTGSGRERLGTNLRSMDSYSCLLMSIHGYV